MKQLCLFLIITLAIILDINIIAWIFNFVDPWLAILLAFLLIFLTFYLIKRIYEKFI